MRVVPFVFMEKRIWRLGLGSDGTMVAWFIYAVPGKERNHRRAKIYYKHPFDEQEMEMLRFLIRELISPASGRRMVKMEGS